MRVSVKPASAGGNGSAEDAVSSLVRTVSGVSDVRVAGRDDGTVTFAVTGTAPFTVAAQNGSVSPTTLSAPGNVTYTLAIDPTTQPGTTINDVITITDGAGNVVTKQVAIDVTAAVARDIAEIPTLTPNQAEVAVGPGDAGIPSHGAEHGHARGRQRGPQHGLVGVAADAVEHRAPDADAGRPRGEAVHHRRHR